MGVTPTLSHLQHEHKTDAMVSSDIWTNDSPIAASRRDWVPRRPAVLVGEHTSPWIMMKHVSRCMSIGGSVLPFGMSSLPAMTARGGFMALHRCVYGATYGPRSNYTYDRI